MWRLSLKSESKLTCWKHQPPDVSCVMWVRRTLKSLFCFFFFSSETIVAIGRQLKDMISPFPDKQQVSECSSSRQNDLYSLKEKTTKFRRFHMWREYFSIVIKKKKKRTFKSNFQKCSVLNFSFSQMKKTEGLSVNDRWSCYRSCVFLPVQS